MKYLMQSKNFMKVKNKTKVKFGNSLKMKNVIILKNLQDKSENHQVKLLEKSLSPLLQLWFILEIFLNNLLKLVIHLTVSNGLNNLDSIHINRVKDMNAMLKLLMLLPNLFMVTNIKVIMVDWLLQH
jgi:hypothetical protein